MSRRVRGAGVGAGPGPSKAWLSLIVCGLLGVAMVAPDTLRAWRQPETGIYHSSIGLFRPDREVRGSFGLNGGVDLSLFLAGLSVGVDRRPTLATIDVGAPVTVLHGAVREAQGRLGEVVEGQSDGLTITEVSASPDEVVYSGATLGRDPVDVAVSVTGGQAGGQAGGEGGRLSVSVHADGADAIIIHLTPSSLAATLAVCLPGRSANERSWWVTGSESAAGCARDQGAIRVEPAQARMAVDLRTTGSVDLHVWSPSATMTITTSDAAPTVGS